jgi:hypothetical protein
MGGGASNLVRQFLVGGGNQRPVGQTYNPFLPGRVDGHDDKHRVLCCCGHGLFLRDKSVSRGTISASGRDNPDDATTTERPQPPAGNTVVYTHSLGDCTRRKRKWRARRRRLQLATPTDDEPCCLVVVAVRGVVRCELRQPICGIEGVYIRVRRWRVVIGRERCRREEFGHQ